MSASTAFYPGPDEIRIKYTSGGFQHEARYNCQITDYTTPPYAFSELHLLQANAGSVQLDTAIDTWVALIKTLFNSATGTIDYAELWHYETDSYSSTFQATYDISVAGTSATTSNTTNQSIFQFRTTGGHRMSLQLMATIRAFGNVLGYPALSADEKAIVDKVLDGTNTWAGRDNHFPASFVHMLPGQNEALFKKLFR